VGASSTGVTTDGRAAASAALASRAAAGDERAFRALVDAEHDGVLGLCFSITRDAELAADAAQAAWMNAWRRLGSLRDVDSVHAWLCTIAANESRALLRRRRRAVVVGLEVVGDMPAAGHDPAARTIDLDLANAMARLDPEDRALLALRYVAGLNASELGAALGMSPSGTRARLGRLLARLREELGDG
jgi:RNA polymerase sigma-70 factor (ECF subfamily)